MGKKKAAGGGLGRALIKERLQSVRGNRRDSSWLHTSELNDGYDWGRLNLQSVTEQSSMDDFLATAELAGTEFIAEKLNIAFVPAEARAGVLTSEEKTRLKKLHEDNKHFLRIPRRPNWDESTSPEALQTAEKDSFLQWRRELAQLEEEQKLILTPFERNLEFWRQLWRVIERSDVIVQIVDGRNPLLFRCPDLELKQRKVWAKYFEREGLKTVFWSALAESNRLDAEEKGIEIEDEEPEESDNEEDTQGDSKEINNEAGMSSSGEEENDVNVDEEDWKSCSEEDDEEAGMSSNESSFHNSSRLLHKEELLSVFKSVHSGRRFKEGHLTVGLVGYPNVGKSSTINTILRDKKVSVSATPGHTKHFQTLYVEPGLCLCDCPGLVMPSFVSTKAEMICCGILSIDQMRDHVPAVSQVCQTIPRHVFEGTYGVNIIRPREDEDPDRPATSEELLTAYGYMRGFMTSHGQPDQPRSARYILKDYVNGKLLYCHPPPNVNPKDFQPQHSNFQIMDPDQINNSAVKNKNTKIRRIENTVDKNFFHQENVRALSKGVQSIMGYKPGSGLLLLLSHAALGYERCRYQVESGREATVSLYSLLGNSCGTIGAILSRQLHIQVVLATVSVAMDALSFITLCIPICLCRNSRAGMRMRARRRSRLYVVPLFMATGGFIKVRLGNFEMGRSSTQRVLLQVPMEGRKRLMTKAQVFSLVLRSLAGSCYVAALLLYDTSSVFIWRTMPWLLAAALCAIIDLLIVLIHLCQKQGMLVLSPDSVSLLGQSTMAVDEEPNEEKVYSMPQIKKNVEKLSGPHSYLHVSCSSSPVLFNFSRAVKKEQVPNSAGGKDEDCLCSSDTSFDSSVVSSDLEWDFEKPIVPWCGSGFQVGVVRELANCRETDRLGRCAPGSSLLEGGLA
uniref:Large subunit GTPase 1 homolog n=1 Tax=Knipowitschia caucasica TaxID=637954 RepID=A0AAV2L2G6_KNICA